LRKTSWKARRLQWVALALLTACTSTTESAARSRQDVSSRLPAIRSAALISIDIKEYEVLPGSVIQFKEESDSSVRQAIQDALVGQFAERQIALRSVDPAPGKAEEIQDLRALSEAINASLQFPRDGFDYSLGPVGDLVDLYGVDALVFVWARGWMYKGGKKPIPSLSGGSAVDGADIAITLVDRSGDVLWYDRRGRRGDNTDLRSSPSLTELARALIGDLPPAKP